MRRPIIALIALVACVAALTTMLTVVATDTLFDPDDGLREPDIRGTFIPDENLASLPVFTAEDEELVKEIALADPRVQAILEGHSYQVAQVGMWNERVELIGGVVDIALKGPSTVTGEWYTYSTPNCETNPDEAPIIVPFRATYAELTSIHVLVNLQTRVVELITPFGGDYQLIGEEEFTGEHQEIKLCGRD